MIELKWSEAASRAPYYDHLWKPATFVETCVIAHPVLLHPCPSSERLKSTNPPCIKEAIVKLHHAACQLAISSGKDWRRRRHDAAINTSKEGMLRAACDSFLCHPRLQTEKSYGMNFQRLWCFLSTCCWILGIVSLKWLLFDEVVCCIDRLRKTCEKLKPSCWWQR